jgi:hypothetical protein
MTATPTSITTARATFTTKISELIFDHVQDTFEEIAVSVATFILLRRHLLFWFDYVIVVNIYIIRLGLGSLPVEQCKHGCLLFLLFDRSVLNVDVHCQCHCHLHRFSKHEYR